MSPLYLDLIRALAALVFTLGLLLTIAWAVRRYAPGFAVPAAARATQRLKLLEKMPLNATTTLYLVEDENTQHLIATGAQSPVLISSKPKSSAKPNKRKLS